MHFGTVIWFDARHGIGAIAIQGSEIEVPIRATQIDGGGRQSLTRHTRVAFRLLEGPGGPHPANIHVP